MLRIAVPLHRDPYSILLGDRLLGDIAKTSVAEIGPIHHAICFCDASISQSHGSAIARSLSESVGRVDMMEIPSGEGSKSPEQIVSLWNRMLAVKSDRGSVVYAIGGGVVGDLAGFAAASFARGIRLVQVPTTLLAMVDSSVGGKTGINLPTAKNIVGAFYQPSLVMIDVATLATLPDREYFSGLAEVVKYGVVMDASFFEWLEENADRIAARDPESLQHVIATSCRCKAGVVVEDERETTGRRAILNYGHTFAHAIESATEYGRYLHGEAVSIGMSMAAHLSVQMNRIDASILDRQTSLLKKFNLPVTFPKADPDEMIRLMQHDKKVVHGSLTFVLPSQLGEGGGVKGVLTKNVRESIVAFS